MVGVGWFEEYPWLLIPIVIVTVEAWSALKTVIRRFANRTEARKN